MEFSLFTSDCDSKYLRAMRLTSGFFADLADTRLFEYPDAFVVTINPTWAWFFLRNRQLLLFIQDPVHLATKWRNRMLSKTAELIIGRKTVCLKHLADMIDDGRLSKIDHGLTVSDLNPRDRQNFQSCLKITSEDVLKILRENADAQATYLYLKLLKYIVIAYIDKSTSIHDRLHYSWVVVFVCRFWSTWIKYKSFTDKATKTPDQKKEKYFITMPAYWSVEINAHNLLYLTLLVQQQKLPMHALNIFLFNSQACESIFRNARSLSGCYSTRVNFTIDDFLRRAEKITLLEQIKCTEQSSHQGNHLIFPVHHKHKRDDLLSPQTVIKIDDLNVEEIIVKAYQEAKSCIDMLGMATLLKQYKAYELNDLSTMVQNHLKRKTTMKDLSKLESDCDSDVGEGTSNEVEHNDGDDHDFDDDEVSDDDEVDSEDDDDSEDDEIDYDDNGLEEDDDENNRIATVKTEFHGMRIRNSIDTNLKDSYFRVTINDDVKYIHKQTACWMLTEKQNRLSSDRLSRVIDMSKRE